VTQKLVPARAVPPGRILSRELEARGWTQKDLAQIMGRPEQAISEIICAKKQIAPETALQLAEAFGTSPELWMNLETSYRLLLARDEREKTIVRRSTLYSLVPVGELLNRGWIESSKSVGELEKEVCSLLGISSPAREPHLDANFRHKKDRQPARNSVICWVNRVKRLAGEQDSVRFDRARLKKAIPKILECSRQAEDVRALPKLLRDLGIHFLIVPHLPETYLDGAAFHVRRKPVVALTLRYDRIDSFWFTLMHELAHVVAGHGGMYLDDLDEASDDDREQREANEMASHWVIDSDAYMEFVRQTNPHFSRLRIVAFAKAQGRHPGIVLGKLQYDGWVPYRNLRGLLERVSPYLRSCIDVRA